jgi:prefoldin subunit 5
MKNQNQTLEKLVEDVNLLVRQLNQLRARLDELRARLDEHDRQLAAAKAAEKGPAE